MTTSRILAIIAIVLFAIAAIAPSLKISSAINLVAAGLFFWALSTIV